MKANNELGRFHIAHDLEFSCICQGMAKLDSWAIAKNPDDLAYHFNFLVDLGVTTFDHADVYGQFNCQKIFGNWLKTQPHIREKIEIVSKCGVIPPHQSKCIRYYDTSKKHLVNSVNNSLNALHSDYLDLLLLHREDPLLNPEEIADTVAELIQTGKILHFGVSNFSIEKIKLLKKYLNTPIVVNQIELNLKKANFLFDGLVDFCKTNDIKIMSWSPLAAGDILPAQKNIASLNEICDKYACNIEQLWMLWLFCHPAKIIPVVGTSSLDNIKKYVSTNKMTMEKIDWFKLAQIYDCFFAL